MMQTFTTLLQLRTAIDGLLNQLKELPARLRHYASYEHIKRTLQGYAKVLLQLLIISLKEAVWSLQFAVIS